MRMKLVAALAAIAALTGLSTPQTAIADGWHGRAPAGYGRTQNVRHWRYTPRYSHIYRVDYVDPYAYRYVPRRYYPYYNSGQWRPLAEVRQRRKNRYNLVHPPYYQAWGYPNRNYVQRRSRRW